MTDPQIQLNQLIAGAAWTLRSDYGPGVSCVWPDGLADALDWSCRSCRDEVGWPKWERLERSPDGQVAAFVECGHCGDERSYDASGAETTDD